MEVPEGVGGKAGLQVLQLSQRSLRSALTMVFLALADPGAALAGENPVGVLGDVLRDGRVIRVPVVKREAARRKQLKSASGDSKRRLLPPVSPLHGGQPERAKKKKKLWPPVIQVLSETGPGGADGTGGQIEDTPCGLCPVKDIECGVVGDGVLTAGDCQLEDGSFIDVWRLEIEEPRQLNIKLTSTSFDTYLFVLNDQCELMFLNDDCGIDNFDESCVDSAVAAGTYFVLVNSFGAGETGAYNLDVACDEITACVDCLADKINCNETLSGELFDDDCVDAGGAHFDIYGFEVLESSRIHAVMQSESFDTFLELLDGDCIPVASNDDCAPQDTRRSCIVVDLEPGEYHLRLTSFGAGAIGPFDVTLECFPGFDPCVDCVVGAVECGEMIESSFPAKNACVGLDGSNLDLYSFDLAEAGPVTVNLNSEGFDTFLRLFDANCEEIATNDDCREQNFDLSCLEGIELEAGSYFVGVSSFAPGESGNFSLEVRCPDFTMCRECVIGSVSCGETASGVLGAGACKLDDGRSHDLWRLEVFGQDSIDLTFAASAEGFEPVLALLNSSCEVICEGESPDVCRAFRQMSPGTYYVRVSGNDIGAAGAYDLQVDCSLWDPCTSCLSPPIACGTEQAGTLQEGDCLFGDGTFFDTWPFSLDRAQTVTISLTSPDFDTFLFMADSDCFPITTNDDCAFDTTNSCLTLDLLPGDYFVAANSFAPATGGYGLSLSCSDIATCVDCSVGSVSCGEPVSGSLPTSGCQLGDGSSVDYYELVLPAEGLLDLRLTSTQFDTFLLLFDESCVAIAGNDDCEPENFDESCIFIDLPRGTYYAAVTSFSAGETGAYELLASCPEDLGPAEGLLRPGDCNGDGALNIADGLCLLNELFAGLAAPVTCGGVAYFRLPLSDFDGDGATTLTDAVGVLTFLFGGGPPHILGEECVAVEACESACDP